MSQSVNEAIQRAVSHKGSSAALAAALGVSRPAVSQWLRNECPVPMRRCIEIERETGGAVRCEELRPDIDWSFLRDVQATPA